VEHFENFPYPSFEAQQEAAHLIYDTYIHPAGLLHVESVTTPVRKITLDMLTRCGTDNASSMNISFNSAKLQVWDVLEQVFTHFITEKDEIYRQMIQSFGIPQSYKADL
jgi:hypothetical protein